MDDATPSKTAKTRRRMRARKNLVTHSPVLLEGKIYEVEYERGDEVAIRAEGSRLIWVRPGQEVDEVD